MKVRIFWAVTMLFSLFTASCSLDAIFYIISTETAPKKPRIEGAPTNMVVFNREKPDPDDPNETIKVPVMYVASGKLHWYAGAQWDTNEAPVFIPQPGGKISSLAVTTDDIGKQRLYALCWENIGVTSTLKYIESDGNTWNPISNGSADYPVIQTIFADPDSKRLFAGAGKNDKSQATYGILHLDNNTLKTLKPDSALLSGVICRKEKDEDDNEEIFYYLSTQGKGIFRVSEDNSSIDKLDGGDLTFMSMIKLKNDDEDDTIIAIERDKVHLYKVEHNKVASMDAGNKYATTAVALWQENIEDGKKLFIVGTQGTLYTSTSSSYTNGYIEFDFNEDGSIKTDSRRDPDISVGGLTPRYAASLGKHPVNHMFQVPKEIDSNMTFFASTQTAGLWSYRNRPNNGGWQWNAEE